MDVGGPFLKVVIDVFDANKCTVCKLHEQWRSKLSNLNAGKRACLRCKWLRNEECGKSKTLGSLDYWY